MSLLQSPKILRLLLFALLAISSSLVRAQIYIVAPVSPLLSPSLNDRNPTNPMTNLNYDLLVPPRPTLSDPTGAYIFATSLNQLRASLTTARHQRHRHARRPCIDSRPRALTDRRGHLQQRRRRQQLGRFLGGFPVGCRQLWRNRPFQSANGRAHGRKRDRGGWPRDGSLRLRRSHRTGRLLRQGLPVASHGDARRRENLRCAASVWVAGNGRSDAGGRKRRLNPSRKGQRVVAKPCGGYLR